METIFTGGTFLLPETADLPGWPVIACDQFTSDRAYWKKAEECAGRLSALRLILPEVYLEDGDAAEKARKIHEEMDALLGRKALRELPFSLIYVERAVEKGLRRGLVGLVDLESYDMDGAKLPRLRPSERTVPERIPPRKQVRSGAALDLSHVLLLMDDEEDILGSICPDPDSLLYDMDLPMGGGHIRGWMLRGQACEAVLGRIERYEARKMQSEHPLVYAVGDGNHSLATAWACYMDAKARHAPEAELEKLRWACVELNSVRESSMDFEPIHRLLMDADAGAFLRDLGNAPFCGESREGSRLRVCQDGHAREMALKVPEGALLKTVQDFLDAWLKEHSGKLDYIHGLDSLQRLSRDGRLGLEMPGISREGFFHGLELSGVFPRKTFSIGHAWEKRYYMEARRLKP